MYSRFLSVFGLVVFVLFSSNTAYGQANSLKGYNIPNNSNVLFPTMSARASTGCPVGVGGTAVYPNHAFTGEKLCDAEATRRGDNPAYIKWLGTPQFGTWDSPGDNKLCKVEVS